MNWLQKAAASFMRFPTHTVGMRFDGLADERDYGRLVGDGSSNSIVSACLLWMARTFPEAPPAMWDIDDQGVATRIPKHPMLRLLEYPTGSPEKPGGYYSGVLLWMATLTSWISDGNAYWIKIRSAYDRPVQLWFTPHWMMEPRWPTDGSTYISHYDYRVDGRTIPLNPRDVVHFRHGIDPENTRKGRSPLKDILREIFTDEEAARFTASILKNFGMPGLVVSPEMAASGARTFQPDDNSIKAIKAKLKEEFGGDRKGEPFVSNLPIKVSQFGFSPQELDLALIRHVPEQRVTAALGLPAAVMGFGAGLAHTKVGATMAELRDQAWQSNLIPNQRIIGSEVQIQLVPDFEPDLESKRFGFDTSKVKVLQDDTLKQADVWGSLYSKGIAKRGEARAQFGLATDDTDNQYIALPQTAGGMLSRPPRGVGQQGADSDQGN